MKAIDAKHQLCFLAVCALSFAVTPAYAQMCDMDAACTDGGKTGSDAGTPHDAGANPSDAGTKPDGSVVAPGPDASVSDAGALSSDAGNADAGASATTAACSCETALDSDGRIHLCGGSFDRATCRKFDCVEGTPRPERCPEKSVRLCCDMPERHLYENLYEDCTHPNCESGFRAQCSDFGGSVIVGACEAPALPDDPDTDTGHSSCSIATFSGRNSGAAWLVAALGLWLARRRKRV